MPMPNEMKTKPNTSYPYLSELIDDKKYLNKVWKVMQFLFLKNEESKSHPFEFIAKELKDFAKLREKEIREILATLAKKERLIDIGYIRLKNPELYKDIPEEVLPRPRTFWEELGTGQHSLTEGWYRYNDLDEFSCGIYDSPFEKCFQKLSKILKRPSEISFGRISITTEKNIGFLVFYKKGWKEIKIGRDNSRPFKLLQAITDPKLGVPRTTKNVYERIMQQHDNSNSEPLGFDFEKAKREKIIRIARTKLYSILKKNNFRGLLKIHIKKGMCWGEVNL